MVPFLFGRRVLGWTRVSSTVHLDWLASEATACGNVSTGGYCSGAAGSQVLRAKLMFYKQQSTKFLQQLHEGVLSSVLQMRKLKMKNSSRLHGLVVRGPGYDPRQPGHKVWALSMRRRLF